MREHDHADELSYARSVIDAEARAISALEERLDDGFFAAADALFGCRGRVVVSGMGKAGIMGMKLSASLASTGTPSIFLHPAEAIHGDLGRIVPEDIVILLSNSGESEEVVRLLPHVRRLGVVIVALTGKRESTLAREADIIVDIGPIPEACPHDLAPTTSTAAMHAIGDALTMLVMQRRGFSREQYAMNHPGGSLGRRLMRVKDVMATGDAVVIVPPDQSMRDAILRITERRVGSLLVREEGSELLAGIITDGDIRRYLTGAGAGSILETTVGEVMTVHPKSIQPDAFALEAMAMMEQHRIGDLPVIDARGAIVGIVYIKDLLELKL
jgi:arabinose-5-phosphate isomerase